ncbi:MAG: hypothetical protein WC887_01475 [Candidatus Paceibacterota bacterium]
MRITLRTIVFLFVLFAIAASPASPMSPLKRAMAAINKQKQIASFVREKMTTETSGLDLSKIRLRIPGLSPNQAPPAPSISGFKVCKRNSRQEYYFISRDPDGDPVQYQIEFQGNGGFVAKIVPSEDGIGGYIDSNVILDFFYSWGNIGVQTFRIRAMDTMYEFSKWTTFEVEVVEAE